MSLRSSKRVTTGRSRQRGAVLLLAMVFLLLMAIVAGTVMQTSVLEFFMAGNDQFREEAFQQAQAITTEIGDDIDNFPVTGGVGYLVCPQGINTVGGETCNANFPAEPDSVANVPHEDVVYTVVRQGPLILESLPFRQRESQASSSPAFDAAIFETDVIIDGSASRLGSANVVQGLAVRVVSSGQN